MPKVVITMPAFRAERTLAKTVADIPSGVADLLILVDDASPDNTAQLARELGIDVYVHSQNLGYGGNQKTCYAEALRSGADIIVLLHPDYQYEPKAVPLLIAPILAGDADMTFGSRFAGLGDPIGGGMPVYRYIGNRVTTVMENLMLGSRFSEMHSGLRAYTRRCLLSLPFLSYSDDFVFDSQILIDGVTSGQRVVEVPIPTRYTMESSSISIGRSTRYIAASLAYCARRVAERGRRGRRSPVTRPERLLAASSAFGESLDRACPVCGERLRNLRPTGRGDRSAGIARCARCGFVWTMWGRRGPGATDASVAAALGQRIVDAIGGFAVRGDDLAAVGRDSHRVVAAANAQGWRAIAVEEDLATLAPASRTRGRKGGGSHEAGDRLDVLVLVDALGEAPLGELRKARSMLDSDGILAVLVPYAPAGNVDLGSKVPSHLFTAASLHTALARTGFRMVAWFSPGALTDSSLFAKPRRWFSESTVEAGLQLAVARPAESGAPAAASAEL
jgi:hypothetical protein